MNRMRIGFLGGTFYPVHLGHVQLAEIAVAEMSLDTLVFVPSAFPPHKNDSRILHFDQRIAMLELVCADYPSFELSDIECHLSSPSYFIHTLEALLKMYGTGNEYFFILGSDAFLDMKNWRSYMKILQKIHLLLVRRRGKENHEVENFLTSLGYNETQKGWQASFSGKSIFSLQELPDRISSTEIRQSIQQGNFNKVKSYLPESIYNYLRMHKVYSVDQEG